jgi:hypothetical protein
MGGVLLDSLLQSGAATGWVISGSGTDVSVCMGDAVGAAVSVAGILVGVLGETTIPWSQATNKIAPSTNKLIPLRIHLCFFIITPVKS